ncbi:unnamed protein product [Gadus morhua 'NCC']
MHGSQIILVWVCVDDCVCQFVVVICMHVRVCVCVFVFVCVCETEGCAQGGMYHGNVCLPASAVLLLFHRRVITHFSPFRMCQSVCVRVCVYVCTRVGTSPVS